MPDTEQARRGLNTRGTGDCQSQDQAGQHPTLLAVKWGPHPGWRSVPGFRPRYLRMASEREWT
jgi:hypothetical protein